MISESLIYFGVLPDSADSEDNIPTEIKVQLGKMLFHDTRLRVVLSVATIKEYVDMFNEAFPDEDRPLTLENIGRAIAAFERTLITPSRFDNYMKSDAGALNEQGKRGLRAFLDAKCQTCHMPPCWAATCTKNLA